MPDQLSKNQVDAIELGIVETVRTPMIVLNDDLEVLVANPAFARLLGKEINSFSNEPLFAEDGGVLDAFELRQLLAEVLAIQSTVTDHALTLETRNGILHLVANARELELKGRGLKRIFLSLEESDG